MGQMVSVIEKRSSTPGVVRFEANRSLTGQGHERFASAADAVGPRPAAELARRLFASGQVDGVHVYANIVTVNLRRGFGSDGLDEIVRELYQYWKPGMEPAVFVEEAPAEVAASTGGGDAGGAGPSAYEQLVPEVLRERSKAALARWQASH
ncbi:MAG: NifU N-terminal domain-containing protein [Acidimicrobiales bacterium]|nr:NifU N-terminal domain-containing protein [Acidimicrobiales bacterium]MCB9395120.1 NifU N-terminal domain-containing protein [Acidimicrobiaceae bacterium]